ncbi:MAG: hypothetical protein UX07_C0052G0005 [Parcubacteria group bacterium GW2011_GWA2_45_30]|nr:MAG: hypothetical protein UX07_C0052G0005 [Parcubacteria group bacterium GW2011_GWA2_45_30]
MRAGGGIGIRATLKMLWSKGHEGSTPSPPIRNICEFKSHSWHLRSFEFKSHPGHFKKINGLPLRNPIDFVLKT